ncbi:MAG: hypothetical protein ACPLRP_03335 [Candidatus Bipolaricaulaceae bacterium]
MIFFVLVLAVALGISSLGDEATEKPDLSGFWALFQVIAEHWDVPLVGERLRRVIQVAKIRIEQDDENIVLWSEEVCYMAFDTGTSLVQLSVLPEFLEKVRVGPIRGKLVPEGNRYLFLVSPYLVLNGVELSDPADPLPTSPDDPRVRDQDGDGKPGFTVRVRILGLISGETYVVQRLKQEYRGAVLGPDLIRGQILWEDEQVTLGASASFFLISGKGRPALEEAFFLMRRLQDRENCEEVLKLFAEELRR